MEYYNVVIIGRLIAFIAGTLPTQCDIPLAMIPTDSSRIRIKMLEKSPDIGSAYRQLLQMQFNDDIVNPTNNDNAYHSFPQTIFPIFIAKHFFPIQVDLVARLASPHLVSCLFIFKHDVSECAGMGCMCAMEILTAKEFEILIRHSRLRQSDLKNEKFRKLQCSKRKQASMRVCVCMCVNVCVHVC